MKKLLKLLQKQLKIFLVFKLDIPIKKSWGQNFIIDNNTINKIIKIINPQKNEHLIEIGPGRGALTIPLLNRNNFLNEFIKVLFVPRQTGMFDEENGPLVD